MSRGLIKNTFLLCLFLNLAIIIFIFLIQKKLPPVVPLFYGLPISNSQLIPRTLLVIPSLVSIVSSIINLYITKITQDKFLDKVLTGITLFTLALAIITTINIISLVGKI